jgi:hypothetical protein
LRLRNRAKRQPALQVQQDNLPLLVRQTGQCLADVLEFLAKCIHERW